MCEGNSRNRNSLRFALIAITTVLVLVACPTPFGYYDGEQQLAELAESEGGAAQAVETPVASVRPQLLGPEPTEEYVPLASGESAFFSSAHYVRFETPTADARIYVVEDGQDLSTADDHLYNGEPILVSGGTTRTFQFIAVKRLMYPSAAVTVTVGIGDPEMPRPSFDPAGGVYGRWENKSVSVEKPVVSVDGVTIPSEEITLYVQYTESPAPGEPAPEPADPTVGGASFSGMIELTGDPLGSIEYRIKAIAHHAQLGTSTVAYAEYLVVTELDEMPEPEFDLVPGTYGNWENLELTFTKPIVEIDGHQIPPEEIELYVEYTVSPSPGEPAPEPTDPTPDGTPFTGSIELLGDNSGTIQYRVKAIAHHTLGTSTVAYGEFEIIPWVERYYITGTNEPWSSNANIEAMERAFHGSWNRLTFAELSEMNLNDILVPDTTFIFIDGSDMNANEMSTFLNTDRLGALESWVSDGGSLFLNAAPNGGFDIDFGFDGVMLRYPTGADNLDTRTNDAAALDLLHPVFAGPDPTVTTFTGGYFGHGLVEGTGLSSVLVDATTIEGALQLLDDRIVLAERAWGSGRVMFGGMTTTNFHNPETEADNLRSNILTYLGG